MARLKITEIFHSLQGEADTAGWPTMFVRLTGCPLRCQYCDTAYAFTAASGGRSSHPRARARARHAPCLRHGRRAARAEDVRCAAQRALRCWVSRVARDERRDVASIRGPARGHASWTSRRRARARSRRNRYENSGRLSSQDLVKFVICDRADYDWSRAKVRGAGAACACTVFFSPSHEQLPARELADWILADRLPVRLQVQLHKYLWGNVPGK